MYYKKILIKSIEDLPKEQGEYFCHRKSDNRLLIFHRFIESDREFEDSVWLRNVDWYLLPVEQPMYSREFVEWFFNKYKYYVKFQVNEEPVRYGYNNDSNLPEGTLDELLAYYETNVKENK